MDVSAAGSPGPARPSRGRLIWHATDEARRDWLWSEAYIMPIGAACAGLGVATVPSLLGSTGVAWVLGVTTFLVVLGLWARANRRLTRRGVRVIELIPADRPDRVMIRRADGTSETYPIRRLHSVTVSRDEITRPYIQVRLNLDTGAVQTRPGPDREPVELMAALRSVGVPVRFVTTE